MKTTRSATVVLAVIAHSGVAEAGTARNLGNRISRSRLISINKARHDGRDAIVRKYVNNNCPVDYQKPNTPSRDAVRLNRYVANLSRANPTAPASREARLALWINVYNAVAERPSCELSHTSLWNITIKT